MVSGEGLVVRGHGVCVSSGRHSSTLLRSGAGLRSEIGVEFWLGLGLGLRSRSHFIVLETPKVLGLQGPFYVSI